MATIVSKNLKVLNAGRQKLVDAGLRTYQVFACVDQWETGAVDEIHTGTVTTTRQEITPRPKVIDQGPARKKITNVTPQFSGGGWLPSDLLPAVEAGADPYLELTGPDGTTEKWFIVEVIKTNAFRYEFILERPARAQPD
jgi:hypothetical protein